MKNYVHLNKTLICVWTKSGLFLSTQKPTLGSKYILVHFAVGMF